jgi:hypothetical protein
MEQSDLFAPAAPVLPPPLFDLGLTQVDLEPPGWRPCDPLADVLVDGSGPVPGGRFDGTWRTAHRRQIPRLTKLWQAMYPGWPLPPALRWSRYRLSRQRGAQLPPGVASIAAPTRWQNKHRPPKGCRGLEANAEAVAWYRGWLAEQMAADPTFLDPLRPCRGLACWCPLDLPCHAEVLIEALIATTPWEPPA